MGPRQAAAQQLARSKKQEVQPEFCPVAPAAKVRICTLIMKEMPWPAWLCRVGQAEAKAGGLQVRDDRAPPHDALPCQLHGPKGEACP